MLKQLHTSKSRKKAITTRNQLMILRKHFNIPTKGRVIRKKCLECVCGSAYEVRMCQISDCPSWPYRFGRNPRADDLKVPVYDNNGKHIGYREYYA